MILTGSLKMPAFGLFAAVLTGASGALGGLQPFRLLCVITAEEDRARLAAVRDETEQGSNFMDARTEGMRSYGKENHCET